MSVYAVNGLGQEQWDPMWGPDPDQEISVQHWGEPGCWTGDHFTTSLSYDFVPKSQAEIYNNRKTIAVLQGEIGRAARETRKYAETSKVKYGEYLAIKIGVCHPPGYLASLTPIYGKARVKAYEECLKNRDKLKAPLNEGGIALTKAGESRTELYNYYSQLLMWSPSSEAWTELCGRKLAVDAEFERLREEGVAIGIKALEKHQTEEAKQAAAAEAMNKFTQMLERFMSLLQQLLEAIAKIFKEFMSGMLWVTKFVAEHPKALWIGGGVLVLGVGAFVLRPYISIASTAIGIGRGD